MNQVIVALLGVLTLLAGRGVRAEKNPDAKPAAASVSGLSPLAEKYALKRAAVLKEFAARRRALVESPEWNGLDAAKQKAALDALAAEAKARDDGLTADYDAESRRGRARSGADAARVQQDRLRQLDEQRTRAAQDALRAKKTP